MSSIDLHSHSTASDGALSPTELVDRALQRGITHLALTDHDCVSGIEEAEQAADGTALTIIPGAEFSTTWENNQIHVVGLFIDYKNDLLAEHLKKVRIKREERAVAIGAKLSKLGIPDAYNKACALAGNNAVITRGNYARLIFSEGKASSIDDAFNAFLKKGRMAYVNTVWFDIAEVVSVIKNSGGVAVLAHPRRYDLTNTKLRRLIGYFRESGGEALEVASCQQRPSDRDYLAKLSTEYGLMASQGSDLHIAATWRDLGLHLDLPREVKPVWMAGEAAKYNFPAV